MDSRLIEILLERLKEMREPRAARLVQGACRDYAEYNRVVGVLEGIGLCERELLEFQRNYEEADD